MVLEINLFSLEFTLKFEPSINNTILLTLPAAQLLPYNGKLGDNRNSNHRNISVVKVYVNRCALIQKIDLLL